MRVGRWLIALGLGMLIGCGEARSGGAGYALFEGSMRARDPARSLLHRRGLSRIRYLEEAIAHASGQGGKVGRLGALERALTLIFEHRAPESPQQLAAEHGSSLRELLNRPSTTLAILGEQPGDLPRPPVELALEEHWLFFLNLADLSEHGHWIWVHRQSGRSRMLSLR